MVQNEFGEIKGLIMTTENKRQLSLGEGYFVDLQRKNKIFGSIVVDGKRRRVFTGVICDLTNQETIDKCKSHAQRRMHKRREEQFKKETKKDIRPLFSNEWDAWVTLKSVTWATGTTIDVRGKGKYLKEFFDDFCVDEVLEDPWEKYIVWLTPKQIRLAKHQDYLSSFLKYQFNKGHIPRIPFLRNPDPEINAGKYMTDDVWQKVWNESEGDLRIQIGMMYFMGMRSGEVMGLAKDHIDWTERSINLKPEDTKTRRGRQVPIHDEVFELLKSKCALNDRPYVFPSPLAKGTRPQTNEGNKRAWIALKEKLKISYRRHDLRHTCATNFARRGVSPVIACRILGMSLEVYDRIYCKPQIGDLHGAFSKSDVNK